VVVDEPGDDCAAAEIDAPGQGPGERGNVAIAADGDDALTADRDRGDNRETVVHGDDLAVRKNDVGRLRLCSHDRHRRRDTGQPQHHRDDWPPLHQPIEYAVSA